MNNQEDLKENDEEIKTDQERATEAAYDLVRDAVDLYAACEILVEAGYKNV